MAIVNTNSTQSGSIGPNSVQSGVNIIQDPPTPQSGSNSFSNDDPDGSVGSFNLTNKSTTRKIDNIIKEINKPDTCNSEQSEKEDCMLVMTGSGTMDWIYILDLDHVLQLNEIMTTYNLCLRKKVDTLVKVTSNIDYIMNYTNDHIKIEYCIHVLKEEATNTSPLSSILESTIAS